MADHRGNSVNCGELGSLRRYRDPTPTARLAIYDAFPAELRRLIALAPVELSVTYFEKLFASGMSADQVIERCRRKCRRVVKQLRKDGVLP